MLTKNSENQSLSKSFTLNESRFTLYRDGLFLALTNPKPIILFLSIYPQFVTLGQNERIQFSILGVTFICPSFTLLNTYSLISKITIGSVLNENRISLFNKFFGFIFIMFSVYIIYQQL